MKNKAIYVIFLLFLILPVVTFPFVKGHIDSANHEKRKFAERPKLAWNTLTSFPEQFDTYFSDHLPYKNQLVMVNNLKNEVLGTGTTAIEYLSVSVIRGKEKWLFYNGVSEDEESMKDYLCNNLYTEKQLKKIAKRYVKLQKKLEEMGIELVVLYAANKEQVYPEYMPSTIVPLSSYSRTDQLVDYIHEHTDVPLLYTKEALLKEKEKHQVFYKYDTHWNNLGGFVGGQLLNEYFHGEYVSLDEVSYSAVSENESGDLADLLSMRKIYNDDTVWQIDDYKEEVTEHLSDEESAYEFTSDAKDKRSVLVVKDSFGYAMMKMAKDFAKVTFLKNTEVFKEYCEEKTPDILLVEIVERKKGTQENVCQGLYDLLVNEE